LIRCEKKPLFTEVSRSSNSSDTNVAGCDVSCVCIAEPGCFRQRARRRHEGPVPRRRPAGRTAADDVDDVPRLRGRPDVSVARTALPAGHARLGGHVRRLRLRTLDPRYELERLRLHRHLSGSVDKRTHDTRHILRIHSDSVHVYV